MAETEKAGMKKAGMEKAETEKVKRISTLEGIAYAPYDRIEHPTTEDWAKAYDALKELCELAPDVSVYPNTLGYLCYYGRHTGGERRYAEARAWFEQGAAMHNIESTYKLADMLSGGLGGPEDKERALRMYVIMYMYCREQFENGITGFERFCEIMAKKDDLEALGYLLEAKYAIEWRKQYGQYGDDTVEKNILRLMGECEQPTEEERTRSQYGLWLGRVPHFLVPCDEIRMTVDLDVDDKGIARLEFRKRRKDGKKPGRILWSVAPAMRCLMTDSVVLYGGGIREIWNRRPGETVVCDRYEYDGEKDTHRFWLGEELQCRLTGGEYVLPMDEFWMTELRDHPEARSGISQ